MKGDGKRLAVFLCLAIAVAVIGCEKPRVDEPRVILRLNGSKVIGAELAPALAERFLQSKGGTGLTREAGNAGEVHVKAHLPGLSAPQIIEIRAPGSDGAFEALRQGFCDIGMSTRPVADRERAGIARVGFGDLSAPANQHIIGADGIAIIVSSQNRVNSLTREQVGQIVSGAFSDWSQVGGAERGPIKLFASDEYPHILLSVRELGHGYGAAGQKAPALQSVKGGEISDVVSQDRSAVGFVRIPYVGAAKSVAVTGSNGVASHPNLINVRAGTYPLSRPLYLYIPTTSEGSLSREFVAFALSAQGQEAVEKAGFTKAADVGRGR